MFPCAPLTIAWAALPPSLSLARAQDGCTPLHYAAYSGRLANCTTLLKAGANTEIADASGKTAKQVAQEMKENKVVDLITNGPPTEEAA